KRVAPRRAPEAVATTIPAFSAARRVIESLSNRVMCRSPCVAILFGGPVSLGDGKIRLGRAANFDDARRGVNSRAPGSRAALAERPRSACARAPDPLLFVDRLDAELARLVEFRAGA